MARRHRADVRGLRQSAIDRILRGDVRPVTPRPTRPRRARPSQPSVEGPPLHPAQRHLPGPRPPRGRPLEVGAAARRAVRSSRSSPSCSLAATSNPTELAARLFDPAVLTALLVVEAVDPRLAPVRRRGDERDHAVHPARRHHRARSRCRCVIILGPQLVVAGLTVDARDAANEVFQPVAEGGAWVPDATRAADRRQRPRLRRSIRPTHPTPRATRRWTRPPPRPWRPPCRA